MLQVKFKKLHKDAVVPKYQREGDAGFDFHAVVKYDYKDSFNNIQESWIQTFGEKIEPSIVIMPGEEFVVKTGLACELPKGHELQIRPRSGLAAKNMVTVNNSPGTVDELYRGELMVILINHGHKDFVVKNGDRIAQGVVKKVEQFELVEVEELDCTGDRGGGFGSTGK